MIEWDGPVNPSDHSTDLLQSLHSGEKPGLMKQGTGVKPSNGYPAISSSMGHIGRAFLNINMGFYPFLSFSILKIPNPLAKISSPLWMAMTKDSSQIRHRFLQENLQGLRWAAAARASACQMYPDVYEETYRLKVFWLVFFRHPSEKYEFLNGKD